MAFKLIRRGKSHSPYDLSDLVWVCEKCGGEKEPSSPYQPRKRNAIYCRCK